MQKKFVSTKVELKNAVPNIIEDTTIILKQDIVVQNKIESKGIGLIVIDDN